MKIFIVDYIGKHCGMHYYNEALKKTLLSIPDTEVVILSNYTDIETGRPFFLYQYRGSKMRKIAALFCNYIRLLFFVVRFRKDCFLYLSYGNGIDIPFIRIVSLANRNILDIHEAIAQNADNNARLNRQFKKTYRTRVKSVIVHSQRTIDLLNGYGYAGIRLFVPHFRYCFQKDYNIRLVGQDVISSIANDKVNILFFGNITYDKGIDILISAVNKLTPDKSQQVNIIIAGKDFDGTVYRTKPQNEEIFNIILRHIEDDELVYLYEHTDYVALPYRKTSQSGILEMAFYFRKPIIASDIPYFKKMLSDFPSFGVLSGNNNPEAYALSLSSIIENHRSAAYFADDDYARFTNCKEITDFKIQFKNWMNK